MQKQLLASLLAGSALATSAHAQSTGNWYGAVDVGTLHMQNSNYADPGSITVSGGYRFNPHLAAEAGITGVGDTTITDGSGSRTARQADVRFLAVGFLPVSQNFEFFGKLGLGLHGARVIGTGAYSSTPTTYTTTNVIVGAGVQINFNRRFGMRVQYEQLGKSKSSETDPGADISRVSVGGILNF